jgi:crotonobetainyl-CoA:carnitine CoA-transferase CaiB-like acyl-CoA transferase
VTGEDALGGLRVLDLSNLYAGPLLTMILGDFGADVVKVEHPRGDSLRGWGHVKDGVPLWWKIVSRNKRLIALDLSDERDRNVVRKLSAWADVLVENFRPGRLEQWNLAFAELSQQNPGLIMVRVTGFGQTGPMSGQPGFGTLAEAYSGFAAITGQRDGPPTLPAFGLADGVAAITGAYAVLAALRWRDGAGNGQGQVIDLSLYEPLFGILGPQVIEYDQLGVLQARDGNRSSRTAPRNAYRTGDMRWVAVSSGTYDIFQRVFRAILRDEIAEDARFASADFRRECANWLDEIVGEWIAAHTLDEVLAAFQAGGAPIAPVLGADEIVRDPQYLERESVIRVRDQDLGEVLMQAPVPRLSRTPGRVRWPGAARIGADGDAVIGEVLGMSLEEARRA